MDCPKNIFDTSKRGIYVVIDPQLDRETIINKLNIALNHNILAVQIWDNGIDECDFIAEVLSLCKQYNTPLFINNRWEIMDELDFDGVHFDDIPLEWETIKYRLRHKLLGITCTNDLHTIEWAVAQKFDYISFCSMFDSKHSKSCDIVNFETIHKARQISDMPIVLAGGITLDNIDSLSSLDYQGIAVISALSGEAVLQQQINDMYKKLNNG